MRLLAVSHSAILDVNRRLFVELARHGHQVLLVTPSRWRNDFGALPLRAEPLSYHGDKRLALRVTPVFLYGKTAFQTYPFSPYLDLPRWQPDVVYIDEEPWSIATLQWATQARRAHCPFIVRTNENRLRAYPWPFSAIYSYILRYADWITPVNNYGIDVLRENGYAGEASLLPYAVDTNLFYPADTRRQDDHTFKLGFVGRIAPEKGLETLLRAIALLRNRGAQCEGAARLVVHIYGASTDDYLAWMKEFQQELSLSDGMVRWHGAIAHIEVPTAIRDLDALVVPTVAHNGYKEQFGRVVIEALASKAPVITSDNGELPLLTRETGGGMVFPEGNASALADCLTVAMRERKALEDMAQHGYDYVLGHYTYGMLATRLEEIMQRVTTSRSGRTHGGCVRGDR